MRQREGCDGGREERCEEGRERGVTVVDRWV